jgi:hypothetical protein
MRLHGAAARAQDGCIGDTLAGDTVSGDTVSGDTVSGDTVSGDKVSEAVGRLAAALPRREDARVLTDFLEQELRDGLEALEELQAHIGALLAALRTGRLSPILLLAAAEDGDARARAELLCELLPQLRRRVERAAVLLQRG